MVVGPDKPSPRHILTREAMKVAGETLQRSRQTSPASDSYVQPCREALLLKFYYTINGS